MAPRIETSPPFTLAHPFSMKSLFCSLATFVVVAIPLNPSAAEDYVHGPDSQRNADVPRGEMLEGTHESTEVFPGIVRRYNVYVPAQYEANSPAALMVFQDGHAFAGDSGNYRVGIVFDNLIAAGDMPVTIAVMLDPGNRGPLPEARGWNKGTNHRSVEYDSVNADYATFLIDEFLPDVARQHQLNWTADPERSAVCGDSSGGICAFGVAWHRPDRFRKVISHIGSFVNIRGGHNYPTMIRKGEKKPLRVLLQDGENDLDNEHGNWPLANRQMAAALAFRDYDHKFIMGNGEHNGKHSGTIFPDELRWLWRDWKERR